MVGWSIFYTIMFICGALRHTSTPEAHPFRTLFFWKRTPSALVKRCVLTTIRFYSLFSIKNK